MSTFSPEAFLNATVNDANDTQYVQVPEGEYQAIIDRIEARVVGIDSRPILNIVWKIDDGEAAKATGRSENFVRQTVWLDVTESGGLDFGRGKNVSLGRLRVATDQNAPGQPWTPQMLVGAGALVRVKHSIDRRDGVTINAEVGSVAKL